MKFKEKKRIVSGLGVLLIVCMLLLTGITLTVNLLFRENKPVQIAGRKCFYYETSTLPSSIESGALVFAEDLTPTLQDVVLYQSTSGDYKLGVVSLIANASSSTELETTGQIYYLTNEQSPSSIAIMEEDVLGVCKKKSLELGGVVRFFTSTSGVVIGIVVPCIILLLYIVAVLMAAYEAQQEEDDEEEETDLKFAKAMQKKQIAETPEKYDVPETVKSVTTELPKPVLTEEEEAAQRAARIAAVTSRKKSGATAFSEEDIPLYTAERLSKTHTMRIVRPTTDTIKATKPEIPKPTPVPEAPKPAPVPKPVVPPPTAQPKPTPSASKPTAKPTAPKPETPTASSASFEDLMAFLDAEEKKLDQ